MTEEQRKLNAMSPEKRSGRWLETQMDEPRGGRCCACGYEGNEETPCLEREDETHCVHWWDGASEDWDDAELEDTP
jgi:hypothetical protein